MQRLSHKHYGMIRTHLPALLYFVLIFGLNNVRSQTGLPNLKSDIDGFLEVAYAIDGPGVSVLVAQKDQIIYQNARGLADVELNVPLRSDHIFRIGSVSKQFTSAAILRLVEQGKLNLQDDITRFIPDYPTHGKHITIEHLLTHTSGIKSYTGMQEWDPVTHRKDFTPSELVDFFKNQPPDFDPGTEWKYNNSGYVLLGFILEKVTGKSYGDYIEEEFFKPLGMKNSRYDMTSAIIKNRAKGYGEQEDGNVVNAPYVSMTQPYAAGSLLSTTADLLTWTRALHSLKVLNQNTFSKATQPYILPNGINTFYGYGLVLGNLYGNPTVEHSGGIHGFVSNLVYLPQQEISIILLSNCDSKSLGELTEKIAAVALGVQRIPEVVPVSPTDLEAFVGVYLNEKKEERYVTVENGVLHSKRKGSAKIPLLPCGPDRFFFENSSTRITFTRSGEKNNAISGALVSDRKSDRNVWVKTADTVPETPIAITLSVHQIQPLLGEYQLLPGFSIVITNEDQRLFCQPTGQERIEIFALSPSRFFMKDEDAELEFTVEANGVINKMTLYQDGQKVPGLRVK